MSVVLVWVTCMTRAHLYLSLPTDGLTLMNEDGGLRVFFPRNSFVTNTTLTHTNSPRGVNAGNDHIACYGGDPQAAQVKWHNSSGGQLLECKNHAGPSPCQDCGGRCQANGAVGQDDPVNGHTDIHMYTDSSAYVNQDLECRVSGGQSAFIGVYLKNRGEDRCCNSCMIHKQDNTVICR